MSYIDWAKAIGKRVRDSKGEEIGEVENVYFDSIKVKEGLLAAFLHSKRFYSV
jgi:sporulation protein YlmC with PRC-barrel domain